MASKDDMLLTLVSMGFDLDACNKVIEDGCTVEDAVSRLLSGTSSADTSTRTEIVEPVQSLPLLKPESKSEIQKNPEKLRSRYHVSEDHEKEKAEFELKKRHTIESEAKRQRIEKKEARKKILEEIAADRQVKKESTQQKTVTNATENLVQEKKEKSNICRLQLRQPTGAPVHLTFEKNCLFQDLYSHVKENIINSDTTEFSLMQVPVDPSSPELTRFHNCGVPQGKGASQDVDVENQPFPRRVFTIRDISRSLEELNLYPSAVLVVQRSHGVEDSASHQSVNIDENNEKVDETMEQSEIGNTGVPQVVSTENEGLNIVGNNDHRESASCSRSRLLQGNLVNNIDDIEMAESNQVNDRKRTDEHSSMFQQALRSRIEAGTKPSKQLPVQTPLCDSTTDHHVVRDIPTLKKISAISVANQLLRLYPHIVNTMSLLSTSAANQVIDVLKEKKKLSPTILQLFLPCKLQSIQLDYYVLTSNDILEKLRWHTNIRRMSLKSCSCVTDIGIITALKGLHGLEFLNLEECTSLTGKILKSIADLTKLRVLKLDKTKIDNKGVSVFFKSLVSKSLQEISMDYCQIDSRAFLDMSDLNLPTLLTLSINHTQISDLTFLCYFPNLRTLSLKNTPVDDHQVQHINDLKHLTALELRGTQITNAGIMLMKDLKLVHFTLPNRFMVTNDTTLYIKDFRLTILDLSDCREITDVSIEYINQMKSLTTLSLSNTKVTDNGILKFTDMQLESLDLSKTLISNAVNEAFHELRLLHTLNLAYTQIDDELIKDLNKCLMLSKLNLSHTNLTDRGISRLILHNLTSLLLDWTEVTLEGAQLCLQNCPRLSMVRNSRYKVVISR